jgi:hypothetical protein
MVAICSASPIYKYDADGGPHFTSEPSSRGYELFDLTQKGLTRSGDHCDPRLPARAAQYDAIIEAAAKSAGVEPQSP